MSWYTYNEFKSKKDLIAAVKQDDVPVYFTGLQQYAKAGPAVICGPKFPLPHKWYANAKTELTESGGYVIRKGSKIS